MNFLRFIKTLFVFYFVEFVFFIIALASIFAIIWFAFGLAFSPIKHVIETAEKKYQEQTQQTLPQKSVKETVPDLTHRLPQQPQKDKFQTQNKDLLQDFMNEKEYQEIQENMKLLKEYNTTKDEKRKKEIEQYFLDELKEAGEVGSSLSEKNKNQENKDKDSYWEHRSYWRYFWMLSFP